MISGWARCGNDLCLNSQYFPTALYPNNSAWFGFSSSDNCCYRVCNKDYYRCGHGEVGCRTNADCADGHYCDTAMDQPTCYELNECDVNNIYFNGTKYCGNETTCTNTVGSFSCSCLTGRLCSMLFEKKNLKHKFYILRIYILLTFIKGRFQKN